MDRDTTRLDEVTDTLDDLKTTVEEIEDNPPEGVTEERLKELKRKIDGAWDAADDLHDDVT